MASNKKYHRFLNVITSPRTGKPLVEKGEQLVGEAGESYPIVNGIPVLVKELSPMHLTPPESGKVSRNINTYKVLGGFENAKLILHLGSGNVKSNDKRVISLDILPCENVDIVGEAECLPFASNTFDLVESGAVFEHVYDPIAAIKEVKRVLKPGGVFRIDNSFLQPYHGFPSHYFAMTPQANETYLIDDFILIESSIPDSGTPLMTVSMIVDRFLQNLSSADRQQVIKMPLGEFLKTIKLDLSSKSKFMRTFSEHERRSMAATHVVIAKKPENYDKKLSIIYNNKQTLEKWASLKREYYTLRTEIMLRHHEIDAYKRFILDIHANCSFKNMQPPESLEFTLKSALLEDPLNVNHIKKKIKQLKKQEATLTGLRDDVIALYLNRKKSTPISEIGNKVTRKAKNLWAKLG